MCMFPVVRLVFPGYRLSAVPVQHASDVGPLSHVLGGRCLICLRYYRGSHIDNHQLSIISTTITSPANYLKNETVYSSPFLSGHFQQRPPSLIWP